MIATEKLKSIVLMERGAHPIVDLAFNALTPNGHVFGERVKQTLLAMNDGEELRHAVISLASMAKMLDDAGKMDVADYVLELTCAAIGPLQRFGQDSRRLAEDLTNAKTARFRGFSGEGNQKRAPKYGVKPTGTVSLFQILPPRPRRA